MTKTDKAKEQTAKDPRKWNVGSVFWGLLLVLIGSLLLLDNLNIIEANFSNLWQLWPVLIIGIGISMLSLRGWLGGLVSLVIAIALLGLVTLVVVDNPFYPAVRDSETQKVIEVEEAVDARELDVSIKTGASEVMLSSSGGQSGVEATQESNRSKLTRSSETRSDIRYVTFSTEASNGSWTGDIVDRLNFDFTRSLPVTLNVDMGASSLKGDLSQVQLKSLIVKSGASSIDLRLGSSLSSQELNFDAGASSIVLHIPAETGVRVESEGGLTRTQFEDLDQKSDTLYESADFDTAAAQITIRAKLGVSNFEIKRY